MLFSKFFICLVIFSFLMLQCYCQEPLFDLPVQLVGFPVIVLSVRLSNFIKKLGYSLNPATYRARSKRNAVELISDATIVEKEIIKDFGIKSCIYEVPCKKSAAFSRSRLIKPGFEKVLRKAYAESTVVDQWYTLSTVVGELTGKSELCEKLSKRFQCSKNLNQ